MKKVLIWPNTVSVYKEKKTKFMLIANNISSNDIRHKMRFFLDKKTPNEPIRNKQIEIIKFNNIGKLILKMLKIIYTYNKN